LNKAPSRTVIAGFVAFLVVVLTLFGALEQLPEWVRGTAQAIGTLAGIYLGAQFQARDQQRAAEGAAKSSILSLIALAKSIRALLDSLPQIGGRLRETPPLSVDAYQNAIDVFIAGLDAQSRALLAQAQAAAAAWYPFVRDDDPFMQQIADETGQSAARDEQDGEQGVSR